MQYLGHSKGDLLFETHHATWITEKDIIEIAETGLNTVRVPIGYWITEFDHHDPSGRGDWKVFAPGGLKYLDLLIKEWCDKHNLAVFLSIHAAKGSQNGYDHSAPPDPGHTYWGDYKENIDNTLDMVEFLAKRYKNDPAFLGIGLLNEPTGTTTTATLKKYYTDAYNRIRADGNSILLSHAPLLSEQDPNHWADFGPSPQFHGFLHEWHKYLIWGFEGWSADRLINEGIPLVRNEINSWTGNWLYIGEWSVASSIPMTDRVKFREFVRLYFEALRGAHAGYTYWTWKTSDDEDGSIREWSFRNLYRKGFILRKYFDG